MAGKGGNYGGPVGGEVRRARGGVVAGAGRTRGVYVPPPARAAYITTAKPVTLTLLGGTTTMVAPKGSILAVTTRIAKSGRLAYTLTFTAPDGLIYTANAK